MTTEVRPEAGAAPVTLPILSSVNAGAILTVVTET